MSTRNAFYACAFCSLLSFACSKQGSSPAPESAANPDLATVNTPPPSVAESPAQESTASVTEPSLTPPPAPVAVEPAPETLTDDQIAKITETVNTGEVEQAKIAQKKSKNARVKKYAAHMITQHNKSQKQIQTLTKKAQITPADSPTSQDLSQKSTETVASLESSDATTFDKTYIDAQVQQHESVVTLLDSKLIPNASNAELKARLEETRKLVETHLNEAKEIQSNLASADTTAKP